MSNFTSLTSQRIYNTSIADSMPEFIADCLVGQSKFETANYTNKHCKESNAYFSYMYYPQSKWQVPGGGSIADNHAKVAKYKCLEDSVHEMTSWIKRRQNTGKFPKDLNEIKTVNQYAKLLQDTGFFQGWANHTKEQNLLDYSNGIQKGIDNLI